MPYRFVRSSKFRHVFGTPYKPDKCYANIRLTKSPHESNMSAVNSKFLAVVLESQGGGAFLVIPLSNPGRVDINYPKVTGHKSLVLEVAWNPFNDNQIASSSEDCTVKLWNIPDAGITENMTEPTATLEGHQKKVGHLAWHPSASDVLASACVHTVFIWNTKTEEPIQCIDGIHGDQIFSISWNYNGKYIATSCKDKKIRVIDARSAEVVSEGQGHVGNKPSKIVFCGTMNKIFSTGFSRSSDRQYALWDAGNLSKSLCIENIDQGSGVLFPFWDEGTKMVYIVGKGDTQIKYFEITEESPYVYFLSMYQAKASQRGACCMPKRELDYRHCEVMRFYKLQNAGTVEPIAMTVPRKSDMFQEDIFPPCSAGTAALSVEDWMSGINKDPCLLKFTRDALVEMESEQASKPLVVTSKKEEAPKKKEPAVLQRLKSTEGDAEPSRPTPISLDEYKTAYAELLDENKKLKAKIANLEAK